MIAFPVVKIIVRGSPEYSHLADLLKQAPSLRPGGGHIEVGGEVTLIIFDHLPVRYAVKVWDSAYFLTPYFRDQRCSSTKSRAVELASFFEVGESWRTRRIVLPPREQAHLFAHLILPFVARIARGVEYLEDRPLEWGEKRHAPAIVLNAGFQAELMVDLVNYFWHWLGQLIQHGKFPSPEQALEDLRLRWKTLGWDMPETNGST